MGERVVGELTDEHGDRLWKDRDGCIWRAVPGFHGWEVKNLFGLIEKWCQSRPLAKFGPYIEHVDEEGAA